MKKILVVNNPKTLNWKLEDVEIVSSKSYLTDPNFSKIKNARVFNLCNDYSYQSKGYYVSLMAEARGHKPIPHVKNLQDLKAPSIAKSISEELDVLIQKSLKNLKSEEFILSIYFGCNLARQYDKLSHELHKLFQAPFLRAKFVKGKKWNLQSIKSISFKEIPETHFDGVRTFAHQYFSKKRYEEAKPVRYQYDLAILVNPEDPAPPSDEKALQKFIEIGEKQGFYVEIITKEDYHRIAEFDALFIRETTNVNHHTYKFARRAQRDGLVVMDDPESILKCSNKVYLAEMLSLHNIPTPKTLIVHSENKKEVLKELGLPCVLKLPDSSFSQGVVKIKTEEEYLPKVNAMLNESELLIAQEWMPTDYDWRIGVLDGKPLYACKYFMAKGHWQIYNWQSEDKEEILGRYETLPLSEVPHYVLETAIKATAPIGKGLYGVDIKEVNSKAMVIEVNDNPNLDHGIEDKVLKDELYFTIIQYFKRRIEKSLISGLF